MSAASASYAATGCVVAVGDDGVVQVLTDRGRRNATLGGAMLARIAADPGSVPSAGDWVELRWWPDGPVTIAGVLRGAAATSGGRPPRRPGVVVPLRRG